MPELSRRLQVLLDESRYARLERLSERRGVSVASLVREAIDQAFPEDWPDRAAAGARLLAPEPMPVGDWSTIKDEIGEGLYGRRHR